MHHHQMHHHQMLHQFAANATGYLRAHTAYCYTNGPAMESDQAGPSLHRRQLHRLTQQPRNMQVLVQRLQRPTRPLRRLTRHPRGSQLLVQRLNRRHGSIYRYHLGSPLRPHPTSSQQA